MSAKCINVNEVVKKTIKLPNPVPHPRRNSIPLENVADFIAKIKVFPVYDGQKQVGIFRYDIWI